MTFLAREIQSYKQLPQVWYHFSTKDRDEPRPRGGLLRLREFIMKDSYTLRRATRPALDAAFDAARGGVRADLRALRARGVPRRGGVRDHGRQESLGFLAPTGSGENELMRCENGDYFADVEAARGAPPPADLPPPLDAPEAVDTPGVTTIEDVANLLGIAESATSKALPVVTGDRLVLALVRGDDKLSPEKLETLFEAAFRPATDDEIRAAFGAGGGSLGPVGVDVEVIADEALREGQYVAGANEDGKHLRGVQAGPRLRADASPTSARPRTATRARSAAARSACRRRSRSATSSSSAPSTRRRSARRFSTRTGGRSRSSWAATASASHARWRRSSSSRTTRTGSCGRTRSRRTTRTSSCFPGAEEIALQAAEALSAAGLDVLLDDRDQRAGEKFADADLIGCPTRITAGRKSLEDGKVDVRDRASGAENRLDVADLGKET